MLLTQRIQRLAESDEVTGNQARPLMDQLIKRVLTIGAGLAPIYRAAVVADGVAVERHMLAVTLHRQLLEIGGEPLQILLVWEDPNGLGTKEVIVPNR